jgi:molybdopterin/thiamine biosynthesis adenylyltransferase
MLHAGEIDEDRLERSRRIEWLDLEKIQQSCSLVVGAGALGNEVVKNLVLAGAGHITLVDMDHVVRSNLNRCVFFREEDQERKRLKAEVVAERAKELDPTVEVVPITSRIEELPEEMWRTFNIVLGCLDNVAARLHANAFSYHAEVPYVDGGTSGFAGRVQVVLPPGSPCLQCGLNRSHYKVLEKRHSCTGSDVTFYEPKVPAEITTTSVVAAIQVREALKILSGKEDKTIRHVLHYHGLNGRWDELEMTVDPQCPLHLDG